MTSFRPFAAPAVLLIILASVAVPAHPQTSDASNWLRLETKHFTFFTDVPRDVALSTAYDLEQLRYALTQLWPDSRFDPSVPILIYIFGDEAGFSPYRLGSRFVPSTGPHPFGQGPQTAGYLVPHEHGIYGALTIAAETRPVDFVYKQYIHQLLHEKLPALPLWLRHGLAEYYSTFEVDGEQALIGLPNGPHLDRLRPYVAYQDESFPLTGILAATELPSESNAVARFFELSWAMVHYLSSDPERRQQLGTFARRTASGVPVDLAFEGSFDFDVATLEQDLAAYLRQDRFNYLRVAIDRGAHPAQVFPLAPHEALYHLGDLLAHAHTDRHLQAKSHFDRALALAPDHGPSRAGLGYVAELGGDEATALAHYEQAIEQARGHFLVEFLYGSSLVRSFGGRPESDAEKARLQSAIGALERSVEEWQDFAPAWVLLGYAYNLDPEASYRAVEALENAHGLLPGRFDVAFNLLLAYARINNREAADAIVERMRLLRADATTLERSREVLLTMDYRDAVRLIRQREIDDAIALFARIQAESRDPTLQERAATELEKFETTVQAQRFGELYKQVVHLLSAGNFDSADALLGEMADIARPGKQQEAVEHLRQAAERRRQLG